jgi:hypothetical protein
MDTKRRNPYPSKTAWAAARAAELRAAAKALPTVPGSDWRAVRQRTEAIRRLLSEAARFDAMAARLAGRSFTAAL